MDYETCPNCGEEISVDPGYDGECPKCEQTYSWTHHRSDYGRWSEIEWGDPPEPDEDDNQQPPPATGEEG